MESRGSGSVSAKAKDHKEKTSEKDHYETLLDQDDERDLESNIPPSPDSQQYKSCTRYILDGLGLYPEIPCRWQLAQLLFSALAGYEGYGMGSSITGGITSRLDDSIAGPLRIVGGGILALILFSTTQHGIGRSIKTSGDYSNRVDHLVKAVNKVQGQANRTEGEVDILRSAVTDLAEHATLPPPVKERIQNALGGLNFDGPDTMWVDPKKERVSVSPSSASAEVKHAASEIASDPKSTRTLYFSMGSS